ncbi:uncharacterized protein ZBIST_2111 [Zygosaccharomyces bailii]|nr:uncharacterized protein ZBIST_2111 [Zygosaccharomyces bailii]
MTTVTVTTLAHSIYSESMETLDGNDASSGVIVEEGGVTGSDSDSTVVGKGYYGLDEFLTEEPYEEQCPGGYHRGYVGETLGPDDRYVLLRKLGWGGYCTVWLALDGRQDRHVAIKIHKSSAEYSLAARKELQMLRHVQACSQSSSHPGAAHVVELLDAFAHSGPHGLHVCLVFEPLNTSVLSLLGQCHRTGFCNLKEAGESCVDGGLPLEMAKEVTRQVLLALDFLHRSCHVVHTDIKPENVMLEFPNLPSKWDVVRYLHEYTSEHLDRDVKSATSRPLPSPFACNFSQEVAGMPRPNFAQACGKDWKSFFKVKLVDLGNACSTDCRPQSYGVQTLEYRAPEIFLQYPKWGCAADIWSTACLFSEMCTARYLFKSQGSDFFPETASQLKLFATVLGPASDKFLRQCALADDYELCVNARQVRSLSENYVYELGINRTLSQQMEQFLLPMLQWDPTRRADAIACAKHPFLRNGKLKIGKLRDSLKKPLKGSFKKILGTGSKSL